MSVVPAQFADLLERPLYGSLATVSPAGKAQSSIMWYVWDGERLKFTHTAKRQKYRNLVANPSAAFSVYDPENPYRYLELRGVVDEIAPDPDGVFFTELHTRYSASFPLPVSDFPDRVVLFLRPDSAHSH
ncbi:MAG: PPOX class F420-dependent oxidoreductase [Segniliparus sp.]|uniref:PPOX class F420-dependent oxidoreductase n=1 Tax=Segniliparus sp. TaxID=2804064 RepID=UPI003F2CF0AB